MASNSLPVYFQQHENQTTRTETEKNDPGVTNSDCSGYWIHFILPFHPFHMSLLVHLLFLKEKKDYYVMFSVCVPLSNFELLNRFSRNLV